MMTENKEVINEDGHTDVPSAKRQCKTIIEDAQAIMGVLDGMNPEDALPTWWTNKLAVASNSMNKMNDYLSNPTEQKEEVELDEAVKYRFVAIDRLGKVIGFASDEKDAKDMARRGHTMDSPSKGKGVVGRNKAKVVKLKKPMSDKQGDMMINRDFDMNKFGGETTYSIGLKEEDEPDKPDTAKAVDQMRDDKKKTRIAQLQLQIAKATEMINKLNAQEKPSE